MRSTLVLACAVTMATGVLGPVPARAADHADQAGPATSAPRASGATPLGQVGPGACGIAGPAAVVIDTQSAGRPSYVAPFDGVITSFSHQANGQAGKVQAIVFADGATSGEKVVAAKSAKLTVATNTLNVFAVRVPIRAGQRLGLGYSATNMACATAADYADDATLVKSPFDADTTTAFAASGVLSAPGHTFRPNIGAVLEPDADNDGFGDVSQDACPASAYTQAVCPEPDTTITRKPRPRSTSSKARVKVKFAASIPGSTFQCRLDGHQKWKPCRSPYKRKLGIGTHRLKVRAVSPVGIADPRPAKVNIRIVRS